MTYTTCINKYHYLIQNTSNIFILDEVNGANIASKDNNKYKLVVSAAFVSVGVANLAARAACTSLWERIYREFDHTEHRRQGISQ